MPVASTRSRSPNSSIRRTRRPKRSFEAVEHAGAGPLAQLVEEGRDGRRPPLEGAPRRSTSSASMPSCSSSRRRPRGWRRPGPGSGRWPPADPEALRRGSEVPGEGLPEGDGGALEALRGVERGQDLRHPHQLQQVSVERSETAIRARPAASISRSEKGLTPPPPGAGQPPRRRRPRRSRSSPRRWRRCAPARC